MNRVLIAAVFASLTLPNAAQAQGGNSSEASFLAQLAHAQQLVQEAKRAAVIPTAPPAAPPAIPKDILYRRSVEFAALTTQVYLSALKSISEAVHSGAVSGNWAVVLDVDETVLDNTQYQLESDGVFNPKSWDAWIKRKACPSVAGAKEFLDKARVLQGGHVVFLTDRNSDQEAATLENLKAAGLFKPGDLLLAKKDAQDNKEARRLCVEKALDPRCSARGPMAIAALIGDSARDFKELYGQDMNDKGRASIIAEAGKKYWILPNPLYGQWQRDYK